MKQRNNNTMRHNNIITVQFSFRNFVMGRNASIILSLFRNQAKEFETKVASFRARTVAAATRMG